MNKIYAALFSILTFILVYAAAHPLDEFSTRVFLTSISIQMISIIFVFRKNNEPYSLNKIFYLFTLFFFGIAPLLQFYSSSSFFGAYKLSKREYYYMDLLILLILFSYQTFYSIFYFKKINLGHAQFLQRFLIDQKLVPGVTNFAETKS